MSRNYPMYEGDGFIHTQADNGFGGVETPPAAAFSGSFLDLSEVERVAKKARAETLAGLISRFLNWIDAGIQRAKYRELEAYLAKSTDLADLENRMRRIEGEPRNMLPVG